MKKETKPLGVVISAFPGMGKSYCVNSNDEQLKVLSYSDSDSSKFSWITDSEGNKVRNPNFIEDYIAHIKESMKTNDITFVSSHENVRKALQDNGIHYMLVYPDKSRKEEFIKNYRERGNDEKFIELLDSKWDEWIDAIDNEAQDWFGKFIKIKLSSYFLADVIKLIYTEIVYYYKKSK